MVVAVVVAGVISVGHGQGHDHDNVCDYDHHPPLRLGARVHPGKAPPSAAFRDVATLVADYGETSTADTP